MKRRSFLGLCGAALATVPMRAATPGRLGIGQIGTRHAHAAGKIAAIRAAGETWRLVGVVEPDDAQWARVSATPAYAGVSRLTEAELFADPDVKAVAVETAMEDSAATALRALRAGRHVHLDKPGALSHRAFVALRQEAEQRGLVVQMGYMLRYNPAFVLLAQAVREGWLGEITEIDAVMGKLGSAADRDLLAGLPGGGMVELGCHLVDLVVALLGPPSTVTAHATPTRSDGVPDNQTAVLVYPRATAVLRTNFADPHGFARRRFSVAGTEGALEIFPLESGNVKLSLRRPAGGHGAGTHALTLARAGGRYDGEFADLARALRSGTPLAWDATHDIAVHATTFRAAGLTLDT